MNSKTIFAALAGAALAIGGLTAYQAASDTSETIAEQSAQQREAESRADSAAREARKAREDAESAAAIKASAAANEERLREINERYAKAVQAADDDLLRVRKEVAAERELREARMERDLAEVDAREATGDYTAREAAAARRQIRESGR